MAIMGGAVLLDVRLLLLRTRFCLTAITYGRDKHKMPSRNAGTSDAYLGRDEIIN